MFFSSQLSIAQESITFQGKEFEPKVVFEEDFENGAFDDAWHGWPKRWTDAATYDQLLEESKAKNELGAANGSISPALAVYVPYDQSLENFEFGMEIDFKRVIAKKGYFEYYYYFGDYEVGDLWLFRLFIYQDKSVFQYLNNQGKKIKVNLENLSLNQLIGKGYKDLTIRCIHNSWQILLDGLVILEKGFPDMAPRGKDNIIAFSGRSEIDIEVDRVYVSELIEK